MKNKNTQKGRSMGTKGFTLVELIIYLAIAVIILISVVGIGLNLSIANQRSQAKREVYMNGRFVINELNQKIKGADDILPAGTTYGSNPATLALAYPSGNNVLFETYSKNVNIGGVTVPIIKLGMKQGSGSYVDITSDKVTVTDFTLTNMTRSGAVRKNVNIQLTITKVNPGNDPAYGGSITLETAVSTRK